LTRIETHEPEKLLVAGDLNLHRGVTGGNATQRLIGGLSVSPISKGWRRLLAMSMTAGAVAGDAALRRPGQRRPDNPERRRR